VHALLLAVALRVVAVSPEAAVATAHPLATDAAVRVLRDGGNAADAAVAAAFALSVVEPQGSGIGGGGFALVYVAREERVTVLDFREVAPAASTAEMFAPGRHPEGARPSLDGGLAVAVPAAVKGYAALARRFGTMKLPRLVEPAARLAEDGFRVGPRYAEAARGRRDCLRADAAAAQEFLQRGEPPAPGFRLVRKDAARTLRLLGRDPEAMYRGRLAARIAAAVRARGGILTAADLAAYEVVEREPLVGRYRGVRIATMPPPSAGGAILLGLLGALEPEDPRAGGDRRERFLHVFAEASKRLYARRAGLLGDPAFVSAALPAARDMATVAFAGRLRAAIAERATPSTAIGAPRKESHTSHVSVVDRDGNAVSLTTTVNAWFGACVVVPGTGLLLNDEMDDFDPAPGAPNAYGLVGTGVNAPAPGKRPLSSMTPTIAFGPDGRLLLVVGAPGGATIPTTVAQAILRVVDDRMPLDAALAAPRLHHQWLPDELRVEPDGLDAATARALEARGHVVRFAERPWGNAQAVRVDPETARREAASDPRYEGAAGVP
jgi:gamma-glutamyltranspeptidase/glutathione hydrolase